MSVHRILSIAAISALAATATATASAADAPVVSKQHAPYGTAPMTIAGTGVKQGDWMGSRPTWSSARSRSRASRP